MPMTLPRVKFAAGALSLLVCASAHAATTVEVRDQDGAIVPDAEVFHNCTSAGRTDGAGRLVLPAARIGDHLAVRKLVRTGTTAKSDHDGWAFHVYLTNIAQNNDGTQTDTVIATASAVQAVTLRRDNAQIGLNLVGSVQYNATPENLTNIAQGMTSASEYLWDITDGQMFLERMVLAEDGQRWDGADIQYFPTAWPTANPGTLTTDWGRMYMPGPGFDGNSSTYLSWTWSNGFRTLVHELGHYGFGAWDEYIKTDAAGQTVAAQCTLDRATQTEARRASFMQYQYDATEMCGDSEHNSDTAHGQITGKSVWKTFEDNWGGAGYTLRTPMSRGQKNPGPNGLACTARMTQVIETAPGETCGPTRLRATTAGGAAVGVRATLTHAGRDIDLGVTDNNGDVLIYGAAPGDQVSLLLSQGNRGTLRWLSGTSTVGRCGEPLALELRSYTIVIYYLMIPRFRIPKSDVEFRLPVYDFDLMQLQRFTFDVTLRQVGQREGREQKLALTYDDKSKSLVGTARFDPSRPARFQAQVRVSGPDWKTTASLEVQGALYQARGPGSGPTGAGAATAAPGWDLFPPESGVGVLVNPRSLPEGTSVTTAETPVAVEPPSGLTVIGGPYSISGDAAPLGAMQVRLPYHTTRFCGLSEQGLGIYRFDGTTWTALPSAWVDPDHHIAYGEIKDYGIFAVLAKPAGKKDAPPRLTCPELATVAAQPGQQTAEVLLAVPGATDDCDGAQVTGARADGKGLGEPYAVGQTKLTWTATDRGGQSATCEQVVTVQATPQGEDASPSTGCACDLSRRGDGPSGAAGAGGLVALLGALLFLRRRRAS